jgi:dTDP-4-amino-4,6-dideoxygalactose transaminase
LATNNHIPLVDLQAQYDGLRAEIDNAIQRVIDNSSFIMGPEVQDFEAAFARYLGVSEAVGVASGSAALQLALLACGIGPGDEVITTPHTFFATAEAISQVGATPVFADIQADTYNLDPELVENAITSRTRAIIPVHLYGQTADMHEIMAVARRHRLKVIEDAAQAHGATHYGRRAGGIGDLACFSFFPSKNLGCYGDGGMVTTADPELAARVRRLRDHGRTGKYEHAEVGWAARLDGLQAAILGAKLPHLDECNDARRAAATRYNALLAGSDVIIPAERAYNCHVYYCYVIRTPKRDELFYELGARGIGAGIHYPIPLHLQPAYKPLGLLPGAFPVSEAAADSVLSLPMYPEITPEQQSVVASAIKAFVG